MEFTIKLDRAVFQCKAGKSKIDIDISKFPANALHEIVRYGVQRKFNDGVASVAEDKDNESDTAKGDAVLAMVDKFEKGVIAAPRVSRTSANPVEDWMRKFARADFVKMVKNADKKVGDYDESHIAKQVDKLIEKNETHYKTKAEKKVAELVAEAKEEMDFDGIDL